MLKSTFQALAFRDAGVWSLREGCRFCMLGDCQVIPTSHWRMRYLKILQAGKKVKYDDNEPQQDGTGWWPCPTLEMLSCEFGLKSSRNKYSSNQINMFKNLTWMTITVFLWTSYIPLHNANSFRTWREVLGHREMKDRISQGKLLQQKLDHCQGNSCAGCVPQCTCHTSFVVSGKSGQEVETSA